MIEGPTRSALGNLLPFNRKEWRLALEVVHLTADHGSRLVPLHKTSHTAPSGKSDDVRVSRMGAMPWNMISASATTISFCCPTWYTTSAQSKTPN